MTEGKWMTRLGIALCLLLMAACFFPWVSFRSTGVSFSGVSPTDFKNGVSYGKPGYLILPITALVLLCMFWNRIVAKRFAVFFAAVLAAYGIRNWHVFTTSLFEGEVMKHTGIYLQLMLPFAILVCILFPDLTDKRA